MGSPCHNLLPLLALFLTASSQSILPPLPHLRRGGHHHQFPNAQAASQNFTKLLPDVLIPSLLRGLQPSQSPSSPPPPSTGYSAVPPPPPHNNEHDPPPPPPPPSPTMTIGIPGAIGAAMNLLSFTGGKGSYPMMGRESLDAHNRVRAQVGEAPLHWDKRLARYAKRWLEPLRTSCLMIHSHTNSRLGENLFNGTGWLFRASDAIKFWAEEAVYYDRETNTCAPDQECGHYTQMVWNSTTNIGCARVECFTGGTLFSCNYFPPGNWKTQNPFVNQAVIFELVCVYVYGWLGSLLSLS